MLVFTKESELSIDEEEFDRLSEEARFVAIIVPVTSNAASTLLEEDERSSDEVIFVAMLAFTELSELSMLADDVDNELRLVLAVASA